MGLSSGKKISIIIPCLNEEQALPVILNQIPKFIDEAIVVDNGSTDKSVEVAQRYSVKIVYEELKGYGASLLKGINSANGDIVCLLDADATYSFEDLEGLLILMEKENLDFVSGCRFPLIDKEHSMPLVNKMANLFISWFIGFLFGVRIKDSQSGLMVFRKEFFNTLEVHNKLMGFSQELKIRALLAKGSRCREKHIYYGLRIGESKFRKIQDGTQNFLSLLNLYFQFCKK